MRARQRVVQVVPSTFEENLDKNLFQNGAAYALETAKLKATEVSKRTWLVSDLPHLVIGADTVVELEGSILEKPKDAANAESMLSRLNGQRHAVHTGVAMVLPHITGVRAQSRWMLFLHCMHGRYLQMQQRL